MIPITGPESSSLRALMRGWALKQATRKASYLEAIRITARAAAAAENTPSRWPSIAEGVGCGAVKPVTVQYGGNVVSKDRRQASVIEDVPLGFIRRMLIDLVEDPVTEGSRSPITIQYRNYSGGTKKGDQNKRLEDGQWLDLDIRASKAGENK
jgi:hypothetical protein